VALKTVWLLSLLLTAFALTPAMAHVLELPNKINLPHEQYLMVQHGDEQPMVLGSFQRV
jgi:hypothetical protein